MEKGVFRIILWCFSFFLLFASSLVKLSIVWGNHFFYFSFITILAPLIGVWFGISALFVSMLLLFFVKSVIFGISIPMMSITFGLPTLVASFCLQAALAPKNRCYGGYLLRLTMSSLVDFVLRIVIPVVCIVLFITHPNCHSAFAYSWYWFIPMMLYSIDHTMLLGKSMKISSYISATLSSTFLAHAIGSVIWAYTVSMSAMQWIELIPMVAIERLLFALSMTVCLLAVKLVFDKMVVSRHA